jgi:hypothetical protein
LKIAIVGAGWYGCHISLSLMQAGVDVTIYEKSNHTISGASKRNQNRLHLGFHYPRDHETRIQSKEGYDWFVEHYGHLTSIIPNNYYAVADEGSCIDGETFKIIMDGTDLSYKAVGSSSVIDKFKCLNNIIECEERVIKNNLASKYFDQILRDTVLFNEKIDLNDQTVLNELSGKYDYVVDCSWGVAKKINGIDYFFEPCIYFYYKNKLSEIFALTIMDGDFYSLYPYYDNIYTLTSVEHTPLARTDSYEDALSIVESTKSDENAIAQKRQLFEKGFSKFYPDFLREYEYVDVEFSIKTKIESSSDFRGCITKLDGNVISVFSGKIDTLHVAERKVFEIIGL